LLHVETKKIGASLSKTWKQSWTIYFRINNTMREAIILLLLFWVGGGLCATAYMKRENKQKRKQKNKARRKKVLVFKDMR